MNKMGEEGALFSLEVHRADYMGQAPDRRPEKLAHYEQAKAVLNQLIEEEACFSLKDLAVKGRDLIDQGFRPGPPLGQILNRLLEAVLDGTCPNEQAALLSLAKEWENS